MTLTADTVTLGVPRTRAAYDFYESAFSAATADGPGQPGGLDLHGTGRLAVRESDTLATDLGTDPATSGFRGYVLSSIVSGPGEVEALLETATANGATVVKPTRKQLFGEFTAVYRAPDGAVWKLAAAARKDGGPVPAPPKPVETAVYLGVAAPKASKVFYERLGMRADHDYGDRFVDFTRADGVFRLGLLSRKGLAKDVGVDGYGEGFSAVVLGHTAASRDDADRLLATAAAAGGRVTAATTPSGRGGYVGRFTDPDGYHWEITAPA